MKPLDLAEAILAGDRRAAARAISLAERRDPAVRPALRRLYREASGARVIGITGPPGAGKSTLIGRLLRHLRARGERVAVLAVDPSSAGSGGAVLGDRVRMHDHAADIDVIMRSMSARGALGGLAAAAGDAVTILGAMGFGTILLETVGVGQSEIEIVGHADMVLLLQPPDAGDEVQAVKAGIVEIADIFVVNKRELAGSARTIHQLRQIAHETAADGWARPVVAVQAAEDSGTGELLDAVASFETWLSAHPDILRRRLERRTSYRILALAHEELRRSFDVSALVDDVIERRTDPYSAALRLLG